VTHGADVNMRHSLRGSVAVTALHVAAFVNDNAAAVRALLRYGADPRTETANGATALDYASCNTCRTLLSDRLSHFAEPDPVAGTN
jgi:ankyrin repeat protein